MGPSKLPLANTIFKHVDEEDKCSLKRLKSKGGDSSPLTEVGENDQKSKSNDSLPLTGNLKNTIYINGLSKYYLTYIISIDTVYAVFYFW